MLVSSDMSKNIRVGRLEKSSFILFIYFIFFKRSHGHTVFPTNFASLIILLHPSNSNNSTNM